MRDDMVVTGQVSGTGNGGGQVRAARWSVPGYAEVKALGSGGFGDVVLARHDVSGTQVAIKYLRRDLLADADSRSCSAARRRCWPRWMTRTWSGCTSMSSRRRARRS